MKLLSLFLLVSCILSPVTEPLDSISGYEYHPGTNEAQRAKGTFTFTSSFRSRCGHKKRRFYFNRYKTTYTIWGTEASYQCGGISEPTLLKALKKDKILNEKITITGIYLFNPMNGRKVGIQVREVNNEPVTAFEVACEFPFYQKNNDLNSDIPAIKE